MNAGTKTITLKNFKEFSELELKEYFYEAWKHVGTVEINDEKTIDLAKQLRLDNATQPDYATASKYIDWSAALYHGSKVNNLTYLQSIDIQDIHKTDENFGSGVNRGFGTWFTPDLQTARDYATESGTVYQANPRRAIKSALSTNAYELDVLIDQLFILSIGDYVQKHSFTEFLEQALKITRSKRFRIMCRLLSCNVSYFKEDVIGEIGDILTPLVFCMMSSLESYTIAFFENLEKDFPTTNKTDSYKYAPLRALLLNKLNEIIVREGLDCRAIHFEHLKDVGECIVSFNHPYDNCGIGVEAVKEVAEVAAVKEVEVAEAPKQLSMIDIPATPADADADTDTDTDLHSTKRILYRDLDITEQFANCEAPKQLSTDSTEEYCYITHPQPDGLRRVERHDNKYAMMNAEGKTINDWHDYILFGIQYFDENDKKSSVRHVIQGEISFKPNGDVESIHGLSNFIDHSGQIIGEWVEFDDEPKPLSKEKGLQKYMKKHISNPIEPHPLNTSYYPAGTQLDIAQTLNTEPCIMPDSCASLLQFKPKKGRLEGVDYEGIEDGSIDNLPLAQAGWLNTTNNEEQRNEYKRRRTA